MAEIEPLPGYVSAPRSLVPYAGAPNGFFQVASAFRKAVTLGGRNLRLGYTADTGISTDVHRGKRRTIWPRASKHCRLI